MGALLKLAPKWKQPKYAASIDWGNTVYIQVIYNISMEYYTAVKMNTIELHATVRMKLNVILSKISKIQNNTSSMKTFI